MGRKSVIGNDRARQLLAQEAARIICEQGIEDYRLAKLKAAERLGLSERGSLPGNPEIEQAVSEHLSLFRGDSHLDLLHELRTAAIAAMDMLAEFMPRLVGPVLNGTAGETSAVNLHVFSDSAEVVAGTLDASRVAYRPFERRVKCRRNQTSSHAAFSFEFGEATIEATVFPFDGIRQAPISPIDGKPMRRADTRAVRALLEG